MGHAHWGGGCCANPWPFRQRMGVPCGLFWTMGARRSAPGVASPCQRSTVNVLRTWGHWVALHCRRHGKSHVQCHMCSCAGQISAYRCEKTRTTLGRCATSRPLSPLPHIRHLSLQQIHHNTQYILNATNILMTNSLNCVDALGVEWTNQNANTFHPISCFSPPLWRFFEFCWEMSLI